MNRRDFIMTAAVMAAATGLPGAAKAAPSEVIELPAPDRSGGRPLMAALNERHSTREFSPEDLDAQTLSDLLWAAWGVNRPGGKRTAPSAYNRQEITVYAVLKSGCFRYEAGGHRLARVTGEDLRGLTGQQDFITTAPLNLVYVADMNRQESELYAACTTGCIAQNVYLYCASRGLNTVLRALIPREELARAMGLAGHERVILAQTVGRPA